MNKQAIRQQARQVARDAALRRRREREERERRLMDLAEQVVVAVAERDVAVADAERRVGEALREFTEVEGLSLREAVDWCGEVVSVREATRLRRLVERNVDATGTDAFLACVEAAVAGDGGVRAGEATG